ncbi:hypothetical protein VTN77DRAFT_7369 [Rasamsonia byssochlamydoides]|uniref:uncharacterized protein n=1 Tax=Rasamsonia byssochlamydoides TaxID=89139 RepID=UPI0037432770
MATTDDNTSPRLHLYSLPNEVLVHILTLFPTRALLPLTRVSHRFHALILRILHYRLLIAASLKEYKLMLECFHPSSKLTEPHVFCSYLGTDGLSDKHEEYENFTPAERLARLTAVYSRFRPEPTTEEVSPRPRTWRPPAGATIGPEGATATEANADGDLVEESEDVPEERVQFLKRTVSLDGFEDFSQLCVVMNLVKVVPGSTLLLSAVTIEDGVIRIWRDWLKEQARSTLDAAAQSRAAFQEGDPEIERGTAGEQTTASMSNEEDKRILWVDGKRNVGLKLRVKEKKWNRNAPVLMHRDERHAVSYEVEIEEVRIRTTRLLLTVEQSLEEQQQFPKAVIFGAYRVAAMAAMA